MAKESKEFGLVVIMFVCLLITSIGAAVISFIDIVPNIKIKDRVAAPPLKSALLLLSNSFNDENVNNVHLSAFLKASDSLNIVAETKDNITHTQRCLAEIDDFYTRGGSIVVISSGILSDCVNVATIKYPNIKFLSVMNSKIAPAPNLVSFYGKMYIVRYLTGLIAGRTSQSDEFGFIIDKVNSETIREVNAFTLGVRETHPRAIVHVGVVDNWNEVSKDAYFAELLHERYPNIEVFSYHLLSDIVNKFCENNSLLCVSYLRSNIDKYPNSSLTSVEANYNVVYKSILEDIQKDRFLSGNFWMDFNTSSAFLGGINSDLVKYDVVNYVENEYHQFQSDDMKNIFTGPIYDNNGELRVGVSEQLSDDEIFNMNWFVNGVHVIYE